MPALGPTTFRKRQRLVDGGGAGLRRRGMLVEVRGHHATYRDANQQRTIRSEYCVVSCICRALDVCRREAPRFACRYRVDTMY